MTMEAADVLLSVVRWLDVWADLAWRERASGVTFRGTTFTVMLMNKRWVKGDYKDRVGQQELKKKKGQQLLCKEEEEDVHGQGRW